MSPGPHPDLEGGRRKQVGLRAWRKEIRRLSRTSGKAHRIWEAWVLLAEEGSARQMLTGEKLVQRCCQLKLFAVVADSGSGKFPRSALTGAVGWELLALQAEARGETVEIVFGDLRGYREPRRGCWLWRN